MTQGSTPGGIRAQPVENRHHHADHNGRAHADRGGFAAKARIFEAEQRDAERLRSRGPEQSRDGQLVEGEKKDQHAPAAAAGSKFGTMIWRKRCQALAPSSAAASS